MIEIGAGVQRRQRARAGWRLLGDERRISPFETRSSSQAGWPAVARRLVSDNTPVPEVSVLRALIATLVLAGGVAVAVAQTPANPSAPCQSPESRQFDFWLGEWELIGRMRLQPGTDRWQETRSTNSIRSVLGGCVTQEAFHNQQPNAWSGMSVSTWAPRAKQWQQTWVDSQGGYILLSGSFADGRMILTTPERPGGGGPSGTGTVVNRMVFRDIAADSLIWDWELSTDGGRTWETQWSITYRRRN